jgi:hypothetical protein
MYRSYASDSLLYSKYRGIMTSLIESFDFWYDTISDRVEFLEFISELIGMGDMIVFSLSRDFRRFYISICFESGYSLIDYRTIISSRARYLRYRHMRTLE